MAERDTVVMTSDGQTRANQNRMAGGVCVCVWSVFTFLVSGLRKVELKRASVCLSVSACAARIHKRKQQAVQHFMRRLNSKNLGCKAAAAVMRFWLLICREIRSIPSQFVINRRWTGSLTLASSSTMQSSCQMKDAFSVRTFAVQNGCHVTLESKGWDFSAGGGHDHDETREKW